MQTVYEKGRNCHQRARAFGLRVREHDSITMQAKEKGTKMMKYDFTAGAGLARASRLHRASATTLGGSTLPRNALLRRLSQLHLPPVLFCAVLVGTILCGRVAVAGKATGGGLQVRPDTDGRTVENISFSAIKNDGGSAKGQVQFSQKIDNMVVVISHLEVDCMLFLDEHTVILGGTVVFDNFPEFVGTTAAFVVRDNGEGENAPADERSTAFYSLDLGFELNCEVAAELFEDDPDLLEDILSPIETGNINVRP
jgi:hypothetical protein